MRHWHGADLPPRLAARPETETGMILSALLVLTLLLAAILLRLADARLRRRPRPESRAIPATPDTPFGAALAALPLPPGRSGVVPLRDGAEAFASRVEMIRAAGASIDMQYYIWERDGAGLHLLDALAEAAGRGVRVRLLLDDFGTVDLDAELLALDRLPGVEIRLFNPTFLRRLRLLNLLLDFGRLNRRMHNKSLTVDGALCLVGGRNIGNAYFAGEGQRHFIDFDVIGIGPVAAEVAADFDRYWAAGAAVPVGSLLRRQTPGAAARPAPPAIPDHETPVRAFLSHRLRPIIAPVELISDDPDKIGGRAAQRRLMIHRVAELLALPERRLDIASAYFVPGGPGVRRLRALARQGVAIRVLTNGIQSTDVALVHCGYARYRRTLLRAGIAVYELRADEQVEMQDRRLRDRLRVAPSGNSLHAKTFLIDGTRLFVGSFNLDQRSMFLNTEIGFIIESAELTARVEALFDRDLDRSAYRLHLRRQGRAGRLVWRETRADGTVTEHATEPGTSPLSRIVLRLAGRLPIEWLL